MPVYGFLCKTLGCDAFLQMGQEIGRVIPFPINLGAEPQKLRCPTCGQVNDYYFSEKVFAKAQSKPQS
jgi:hypothetical protein